MKLVINGEEHFDLPESLNVTELLSHLGLPQGKIAVERNLEIIPKSTYDTVRLNEDDRLEIIHFIGGG